MSGGMGGVEDFIKNNLTGLPIGNAVLSPSWIKDHPKETEIAAITAASIFSGGAAAGLWGGAGALGAGAAGAGAEAGAGLAAGAGSGLAAADYAALGLGPSAGGLLGYGGELASVGETGGTMLGGASPQALSLSGPGGNNLQALMRARQLGSMAQGLMNHPQAQPQVRRPQAQQYGSGMQYINNIYGN